MREAHAAKTTSRPVRRIRIWYGLLLCCVALFVIRLFYLQVIRHDYYQSAALRGQLKEYEIPPERGIIEAQNGESTVPIVLNETRYTLYADPVYVKDANGAADKLVQAIGGDADQYKKLLATPETRYVVLAQKLDKQQSEKIEQLKLKGIGTRGVPYRTYPQGAMAAQLLGFVNNEGQGKYGLEQALDKDLQGVPGQLKAITDAAGVPLAANRDNVNIAPQQGKRVVLTIDIAMQHQLEEILKAGVKQARSKAGSALIIDPKTGAIKAMANYPSYNPADFQKVEDGSLFNNAAVSEPLEVGSIMKPLTAAAALDQGAVQENSSFYDPRRFTIDGETVSNVEEDGGGGTRAVKDILQLSLNTGATWLLMQMGGGELNSQARSRWHDYMTGHYQLGKPTGVEQGFEAGGYIPDPNEGYAINFTYANTSFGQGMTATALQMAGALSGVVNGGTYYQPRLVASMSDADGKLVAQEPKVTRDKVVSSTVSQQVRGMMEHTYRTNRIGYGSKQDRPEYGIGGKTGTAQQARPEGGYYDNLFNGTYLGFVGGDQAQYVIAVVVRAPNVPGYAGAKAAAPIFINLSEMLINNFGVTPKD